MATRSSFNEIVTGPLQRRGPLASSGREVQVKSFLSSVLVGVIVCTNLQVAKAQELTSTASAVDQAIKNSAGRDEYVAQRPSSPRIENNAVSVTSPPHAGMKMTLPDEASLTPQSRGAALAQPKSEYIIRDDGDGAFRALIVMHDSSNSEYTFTFGEGHVLKELGDGSVLVTDLSDNTIGVIAEPWAVDAGGKSVETSFRIGGNTLTQTVRTSSTTSYPVVADPFWIPFLEILGGHFTRHALARMAQRGISEGLVRLVITTGRGVRGNGNITVFRGHGIRVVVDNKSGNIITVTRE